MKPETRSLIELSLEVRSIADTHALMSRSLSEYVSMREVIAIRREMVARNALEHASSSVAKSGFAISGAVENQINRAVAETGSQRLHAAMEQYYARKAKALGASVAAARLASLYSHAELQRMVNVAA